MGLLKRGGGVYRMDIDEARRLAELLGTTAPLSVQLLSSVGTTVQPAPRPTSAGVPRVGMSRPSSARPSSARRPTYGELRPEKPDERGAREQFFVTGAAAGMRLKAGAASEIEPQRAAEREEIHVAERAGQAIMEGAGQQTVEDAVSEAAARNTPVKRILVTRPTSAPAARTFARLPGEGRNPQLSFVPEHPKVVRDLPVPASSGMASAYPMVRPVGPRARAAKGRAVDKTYRQPFVPPREDDPFPRNDYETDVHFEEALRRATVSAMGTGVSRNYRSRTLHLHVALKEMLKDVAIVSSARPRELVNNRLSCARVAFRELIASNHTLGPLLFELKDIYESALKLRGDEKEHGSIGQSPSARETVSGRDESCVVPEGLPAEPPSLPGAPSSTATAEWSPGGTHRPRGDRDSTNATYEFPSSTIEEDFTEGGLAQLKEEVSKRVEELSDEFKKIRSWDRAIEQVQDLVEDFKGKFDKAQSRLSRALLDAESAQDEARKFEAELNIAKDSARHHQLENDVLRLEVKKLRQALGPRAELASASLGVGEHSPRPQSARTWSEKHPQVSVRGYAKESREVKEMRIEGATPMGSFYLAEQFLSRPADRFGRGVPALHIDGIRGGE